MSNDEIAPYRVPRKPMRQVEILTEGEFLLMEDSAADRLESLLMRAKAEVANGYAEDIHKFSLCFESATGGIFTMPGRYWVEEFRRRIGHLLKACDIQLVEGIHGAPSLWDREVYLPRKKDRESRKRG